LLRACEADDAAREFGNTSNATNLFVDGTRGRKFMKEDAKLDVFVGLTRLIKKDFQAALSEGSGTIIRVTIADKLV
jgi:hypothetical protein